MHENCLDTLQQRTGILGTMGVALNGGRFRGMGPKTRTFWGWRTHNDEIVEVDFVGHAWFFERDWIGYLWKEEPVSWNNGEDIHFSSMAKIYGGIPTYCPPHPEADRQLHGSTRGFELGLDAKATSVGSAKFGRQRDLCVVSALFRGWKTVNGTTLGLQSSRSRDT